MRWLLFLSRLAFICGIFFLLAISLRMKDWLKDETMVSSIITIGYFIGMIVVPVTIFCYLLVFVMKKKIRVYVPAWLITANVLFFLALLYYIFYMDDPYYHQ
jgi:hypothetical protein